LLINDVGKTFYSTAFEPGVNSDTIMATLTGTADYAKYFSFAPAMLTRMNEQVANFSNDPVMKAVVNTEKSKYKNIVTTYLNNFQRKAPNGNAYPVNKAVATYDSDGLPLTYNDPISESEATKAAKKGRYRVGDIVNLDVGNGNQLIAVWTGTDWEN
jgi:hypothetical protein